MSIKVFFLCSVLLAGTAGAGLSSQVTPGPIEVGVRVVAKTPLYVGKEAELQATVYLLPPQPSCFTPKEPFDVTLVWGNCWYGGGMELLGDCTFNATLDPEEPLEFPFRVRTNEPRATAHWMVFMRATPEVMSWIGVDMDGKTEADREWPDIGKGWVLLGDGGRDYATLDGDEQGELLTVEQREKVREERRQQFERKLASARAGAYSPDDLVIEAVGMSLAEARGQMDSALIQISQKNRIELAVIAEELAKRQGTPTAQAASFVCGLVRNRWRSQWRTDPDSDVNELLRETLSQWGDIEMLNSQYERHQETAKTPEWKAWEILEMGWRSKRTWEDVEGALDSLLNANPANRILRDMMPAIRDGIEAGKARDREKAGGSSSRADGTDQTNRGWFTVQGYWKYRDHEYTLTSGLDTGSIPKPFRKAVATVFLFGAGGGHWNVGCTDLTGHFSDQVWSDLPAIGLRTYSYTWGPGSALNPDSLVLRVTNDAGQIHEFAGDTESGPTSGVMVLDDSYASGSDSAAANIYDTLVQGWSKIPGDKPWDVTLRVRWQDGYLPPDSGSCYDPATGLIHIRGRLVNTDEWDTDVVLHEMIHRYHDVRWNLPEDRRGPHKWAFSYPAPDERGTAYTEGFAHFFAEYAEEGFHTNPLMSGWRVNTYGGLSGSGWSGYASLGSAQKQLHILA